MLIAALSLTDRFTDLGLQRPYPQLLCVVTLPWADDQIGDDLRRQGHYSDFEAFIQAFDGEKFKKGTVITFSTSRNGTMTTFIDGRRKNAVRSQALNNSLMKLYLGENTITKDVRENTLSSLARFI